MIKEEDRQPTGEAPRPSRTEPSRTDREPRPTMADRPRCQTRASDPSPSVAAVDRRCRRRDEGIRRECPGLGGDPGGIHPGDRQWGGKFGRLDAPARNEPLVSPGERLAGQSVPGSGVAPRRPWPVSCERRRRETKPIRSAGVVPRGPSSRAIPGARQAHGRRTGPVPGADPRAPGAIARGGIGASASGGAPRGTKPFRSAQTQFLRSIPTIPGAAPQAHRADPGPSERESPPGVLPVESASRAGIRRHAAGWRLRGGGWAPYHRGIDERPIRVDPTRASSEFLPCDEPE
jgi:hypothetical protein